MRNPMDSWDKSDTKYRIDGSPEIGPNDLALATKLVKAGSPHAKFTRMIGVAADLVIPLDMWNEFDTYKVGTVRNSCSTMHRLGTRPLSKIDFEEDISNFVIDELNELGERYRETKDFQYRYKMRGKLPWSYLQRSTIAANYAVMRNMYFWRHDHRLVQWREICRWIETLPYAQELICAK